MVGVRTVLGEVDEGGGTGFRLGGLGVKLTRDEGGFACTNVGGEGGGMREGRKGRVEDIRRESSEGDDARAGTAFLLGMVEAERSSVVAFNVMDRTDVSLFRCDLI